MTPERWAKLKEVFGDALELPEKDRPAYLDQNCSGDPELRREVEQLLQADTGTLESPLTGAVVQWTVPELTRGDMLAHYRVETKVGRGGMGTVYRAYDTRLDRRIALKVVAAEPTADPEYKQRAIREARAASGLIHPNIVTIHDVGSDRNIDYIAMEYVEGRPLDKVIPSAGLPPKQALAYAIQIAAALAEAHAAGIVHRDLKPANIIITREGQVKLLDFGLARKASIKEGVIAGTPAYMSPEQVRGEAVDHRSDIFSFGIVLHEMATGRRELDDASPVGSFAIHSLVQRCVKQDPEDRFQSARDLVYALEAIGERPGMVVEKPRPQYGWWIAALAASFALACLATYFWLVQRAPAHSVDGKLFAQLTDEAGAELFPSLSPNGKTVVYTSNASGNWNIYSRLLGSTEATNLTATSSEDDTQPAFSPDGKRIAFRSERDGGGIFLMQADGQGVSRLTDAGYNPAWSPDGKQIVYAEESITRPEDRTGRLSQLWSVELSSGRRRLVSEDDAVQPQWSPDGRHIAYWAIDLDGDRDIWTVPADGGQPVRITRDTYLDWNPVWSPSGAYLYFCSNRGGNNAIWRVPMKESSGEARGAPELVRTPSAYTAHLSFSSGGRRLAYVDQVTTGRIEMVRFDPLREMVVSEPREILQSTKGPSRPALSPDGKWLAFNTTEQQEHLYVMGTDGSGMRQLTSDTNRNRGPRWSPDGKRLAFFSSRGGDMEIWTIDVASGELRQETNLAGQNVAWPVWSPDGRRLAYTIFGMNTFVLDAGKDWAAQSLEKLPPMPPGGGLFNGWSWSPDGQMLAGFLNRGDGIAVYSFEARTFRMLTNIGADPVWLSDNRRLLCHHRGKLYLVDSVSGKSHEVLSIAPEEVARRGFALSPDDRHIYFSVSTTEADIWVINFER